MIRTRLLGAAAIAAITVISACDGHGSPLPTAPSNSAAVSPTASGASASFSKSSSRSGRLHLIKECHEYTALEGGFCTIIKSNLKEIPAGTRVIYAKALVDGHLLDTDIRLETPGSNTAFGRVVIDLASPPGVVTLSGGSGKFAGFRASVLVTPRRKPAASWDWIGPYSFGGKGDDSDEGGNDR
jgi:hypothetical protein